MAADIRMATGLLLSLALPASAAYAREGGAEVAVDTETQTAMAFLTALGRLDFDAASALLDENAELDLPYASKGIALKGRADVIAFFRRTMSGKVGHIAYQLDQAYSGLEFGAIALEVSTRVEAESGATGTNRLVTIFRFRDGKIALFREYFNPMPITAPSPR